MWRRDLIEETPLSPRSSQRLDQDVNEIISTSAFLKFKNKDDFRAVFDQLSEGLQNQRLKELGVPVAQRIPLLKCLGRRKEKPLKIKADEDQMARREGDYSWRDFLSMAFFVLVGVPIVVIGVACIFGALLAWVEEWSFREGFEYVSSNILQLATPLTDVTPDNLEGEIMDIIIAVWSLSIAGLAIGFMASFSILATCAEAIESKTFTDNTEIHESLLACDRRLDLLTKGDDCFLAQVDSFAKQFKVIDVI